MRANVARSRAVIVVFERTRDTQLCFRAYFIAPTKQDTVSSNIFLARSSPADFDATVRSAVTIDEYPDCPEAVATMEAVRLFGAPESQNDTFERMTAGDLVLFHQEGEYVGTGWINTTFEDDQQWASTALWSETESPLIYTLEAFTPVAVPISAVNRIFGYADGYTPPNVMRVASNRVDSRPKALAHALAQYTDKHT